MKHTVTNFQYAPAIIQSLQIAFNRSATQIASIVITSLLGLTSTQILAEFGLSLTLSSLFFVAVTTIQLGIQAEFGKNFASKQYEKLLSIFLTTALIILVISGLIGFSVWLLPNPFSSKASIELAENAYEALKILMFSLPLVGILTTITFFLESIGYIKKVTVLRLFQVWFQVGLVLIAVLYFNFTSSSQLITAKFIATLYVISDFIMLIIGLYLLILKFGRKINYKINFKRLENYSGFIDIFKIGFPVMIGMLGQRFIFYSYANFAASIGVIEASVFSIINSLVFFCQIPLLGVAHLLTIKLSQSRGGRNLKDINLVISDYSKLFLKELLFISVIVFSFQSLIFQFFTNDDLVFQLMSSMKFEIFLYFLMNAMLTYSMSCLRGFSDTMRPQLILISLLAMGILILYAFYFNNSDMKNIIFLLSASGFLAAVFLQIRINNLKRAAAFNNQTFPEKSFTE